MNTNYAAKRLRYDERTGQSSSVVSRARKIAKRNLEAAIRTARPGDSLYNVDSMGGNTKCAAEGRRAKVK